MEGRIGQCNKMKNFKDDDIYFKIFKCNHKSSYSVGAYSDTECKIEKPIGVMNGDNAWCHKSRDNQFYWARVEVAGHDDFIIEQQEKYMNKQKDEMQKKKS